jgi:hypothetical protein
MQSEYGIDERAEEELKGMLENLAEVGCLLFHMLMFTRLLFLVAVASPIRCTYQAQSGSLDP